MTLLDDLVVAADSNRLQAREVGGPTAWDRTLDAEVQWMQSLPPHGHRSWTSPLEFPGPRPQGVFVLTSEPAQVDADGGNETWREHLVTPDGELASSRRRDDGPSGEGLVVDVELDGATWTMCLRSPDPGTGTDRACPAQVALADPDGTVHARLDPDSALAGRTFPRSTRTGRPGPA